MIQLFKQKKEPTLRGLAKQIEEGEKKYEALLEEFRTFKDDMRKSLTKIGIVRFNPFQDTGSDQSFAIALLDDRNNGVVITSHYLKDHNRMYAKPVNEGKSEYTLSEEENQAIEQAIKSNGENSKLKTT